MDNDVKSYSQSILYNKDNLQGRTKILINVEYDDFINDPVGTFERNFTHINNARNKNNEEINYLIKYKKGVKEILEKLRADGSDKINNISISNFAHEFVEFKKGFIVGKPIKYVNQADETTEDMSLLLKYLKKVNKKSKDLDKYENLFTFGIAHTFTKFDKKSIGSDLNYNSPFTYDVVDSTKVCCVYSSDLPQTKLFSMVETNMQELADDKTTYKNYTLYTLYYGRKSIILKKGINGIEVERVEQNEPNDDPITEYCLNQSRMGVFEPVLSSLNTLNMVRSNQLDDIEQFINAYMVFVNQDAKYIIDHIKDFRKNRIFAIKTNNEKTPADVKLLQTSLEHGDINQIFNDTKQDVFNQVGVPMATSNTGQGVSGEAQTYGGGWENAQAIANIETTYVTQFEREDLGKFIAIATEVVNSKIKELNEVDVEIKYTINKSNNILTKMQSFKYWIDLGGSWERGLEIIDLTDDSYVVGRECEKNWLDKEKTKIDLEVEKQKKLDEVKSSNQTNDISGNGN